MSNINRNTVKRIKKDIVTSDPHFIQLRQKFSQPKPLSMPTKTIMKQREASLLEQALEKRAPKMRPHKMKTRQPVPLKSPPSQDSVVKEIIN